MVLNMVRWTPFILRFISTRFGGALEISNFITCLHKKVLEVNYLFHAESVRNYLFQKH